MTEGMEIGTIAGFDDGELEGLADATVGVTVCFDVGVAVGI